MANQVIIDETRNQISVIEGQTRIIEVAAQGPQGPIGPRGETGPSGSSILNQITSGSVTASVDIGSAAFTVVSASSNLFNVGSNGNVGIGVSSPTYKLDVLGALKIQGAFYATSNGPKTFLIDRYSNNPFADEFGFRKARGTMETASAVISEDQLGGIEYYGYDGSGFIQSAMIYSNVDGTVSAGSVPGRLSFYVNNGGSTNVNIEAIRINSSGNVGIGTVSPNAKLHVSGSTILGGNTTITGSLLVTGNITAQTLVVQTITSSVLYSSGSNIFGNSLTNTQQFTGSVSVTGSLSVNGGVVSTGTGISGQVVYWTGTNAISGSSRFTLSTSDVSGLFLNAGTSFSGNLISIVSAGNNGFIGLDGTGAWAWETGALTLNANTANRSVIIGTQGVQKLKVFSTGNVLIQNGGTFTDTGERLQVTGDVKIVGSGATDTTTALRVQNSSNLNIFRVRNDGALIFGNANNAPLLYTGGGPTINSQALTFGLNNYNSWGNGESAFSIITNTNTTTAGTSTANSLTGTFAPGSGSHNHNFVRITATINQTGGANGITRGLYIQPFLTSAADFRAIEWSNNAATSPSASWGLYGAGTAPNYINGNLLVGTTSDTGEKLQVGGTMKVTGYTLFGSGNSGTPLATLVDFRGGSDTDFIQVARASTSSDRYVRVYANGQIDALSTKTDSAPFTFAAATNANTSGNRGLFTLTNTFNPTSGTATYTVFAINQTINQTGGASGITRGLYVNPTITAAADFRAIEWSNNAATSPSASWGLYGAGTAPNYLAGNLGIGTNSPIDFNLVVQGLIQVRAAASSFTGLRIDSTSIRRRDTGTFSLGSNDSATAINIFSTNNVAINSTSDSGERLQVSGSSRFGGNMFITGSATITAGVGVSGASTFTIGGGTNFILNGALGGQLVYSYAEYIGALYYAGFSGTTVGMRGTSAVLLGNTATSYPFVVASDRVAIGHLSPTALLHVSGTTGGLFEIDSNTASNILYVSSSGNVGIGTNTPSQILNISRNQNALTQILVQNTDVTDVSSRSSFQATNGTVSVRLEAIGATGSYLGTYVGAITNHRLYFWTNGIERGYFSISGSLVLGNISTGDTGEKLQVTGTMKVTGASSFGSDMTILGSGATSGTNGLLVQNSSAVSTFIVRNDGRVSNGDNTFYVDRYSAGGTTMVVSNTGHNGATGISVRSAVGIIATSNLGVSVNNPVGASIYAAGGNTDAPSNISLGLISNRALITSTASGMNMHTSSMLQVDSTTQGFLPPRMTTTQKNAITTPAAGLVVYDTTLNKLCVYTTTWETITSS